MHHKKEPMAKKATSVVRGLCAEVGGEEVHANVGGAFAEVDRGEVGCLSGDGLGGVGEGCTMQEKEKVVIDVL
jgi:hypothetical protein